MEFDPSKHETLSDDSQSFVTKDALLYERHVEKKAERETEKRDQEKSLFSWLFKKKDVVTTDELMHADADLEEKQRQAWEYLQSILARENAVFHLIHSEANLTRIIEAALKSDVLEEVSPEEIVYESVIGDEKAYWSLTGKQAVAVDSNVKHEARKYPGEMFLVEEMMLGVTKNGLVDAGSGTLRDRGFLNNPDALGIVRVQKYKGFFAKDARIPNLPPFEIRNKLVVTFVPHPDVLKQSVQKIVSVTEYKNIFRDGMIDAKRLSSVIRENMAKQIMGAPQNI